MEKSRTKKSISRVSSIRVEMCGYGGLMAVVVALLCMTVVYCLHSARPPTLETCALQYAYAHATAVVAGISMLFGFLSLYATLKVNESVLIHGFRQRYSDEKVGEDICLLRAVVNLWAKNSDQEFIRPKFTARSPENNPKGPIEIENREKFIVDGVLSRPWTEEQDKARRSLKGWYCSACRLYLSRSIGKSALRDICSSDAITLLFDVVEPMEALINKEYDSYRELHGIMKVMKERYLEIKAKNKDHEHDIAFWDDERKGWVRK